MGDGDGHAKRRLVAGVEVSPLSLGGALLGLQEGPAILRLARASGIKLVDTSSAYGPSEKTIGASPHEFVVATKFGNPCELNGGRHDYSVAHARACLEQSASALGGKRIACLQLHSPPEWPSPVANRELVAALNGWVREGAIGGWGASVHTVNGGQIMLDAGATMLQVPYSVLQQEHAPLLAVAMLRGAGVLAQSALCQGWLTDAGVAAARLLLHAPARFAPERIRCHAHGGRVVAFRELLRRVLAMHALARDHAMTISELALRFVVHSPGATSALVQVRSPRGARAPTVRGPSLSAPPLSAGALGDAARGARRARRERAAAAGVPRRARRDGRRAERRRHGARARRGRARVALGRADAAALRRGRRAARRARAQLRRARRARARRRRRRR